jgi:hypothetical protein
MYSRFLINEIGKKISIILFIRKIWICRTAQWALIQWPSAHAMLLAKCISLEEGTEPGMTQGSCDYSRGPVGLVSSGKLRNFLHFDVELLHGGEGEGVRVEGGWGWGKHRVIQQAHLTGQIFLQISNRCLATDLILCWHHHSKFLDRRNLILICIIINRDMRGFNPLPCGTLATFFLMAVGPIQHANEDDIGREKTILMTSLRLQRAAAVRRWQVSIIPLPPTCRDQCEQPHVMT